MSDATVAVNPWIILPFGVLLALIALAPLLFPAWWRKHYAKVACGLGAVTLAYYFIGLRAPEHVWHTAHEYVSFIALIGSLYIVAGGIHINVKGEATPFTNTVFIFIGAVLSNLLGTTGASMLLIRPWLRTNQRRVKAYHVVFFIFIVSNVGGCLTPIGDPPLFLGYLMGVPFWWVAEHCLPIWAVGVGILLAMFFVLDWWNCKRMPKNPGDDTNRKHEQWRFEGLHNLLFLAVILGAIFIPRPVFLREGLMIVAAIGSWFTTPKAVHESNDFDFHPIEEVAILFIGIFATMMPALDWLQANAGGMQNISAALLYWGSGSLSSALDNAPTYLCFFKTISGRFASPDVIAQLNHLIQNHGSDIANISGEHAAQIKEAWLALQKYHPAELAGGSLASDQIQTAILLGNIKSNAYILAISVGSVFFGANTYIANGPNFMVKSIADRQKVPMPGFLAYIWKYTLPFVLPMLAIVWWIFFRI